MVQLVCYHRHSNEQRVEQASEQLSNEWPAMRANSGRGKRTEGAAS